MNGPDVIAHDCACTGACHCGEVSLPVNPFVSNRYHFGMLLGVADLETEQAYHRGKTWLHNGWLHGIGVVWGLGVEVRAERNEVVVHRGLAVDGHGRELSVPTDMCVDLGEWFAKRRPDDLEITERPDGGLSFTVHVELCHDSCLDRPVPSISEPCEDATSDVAYSRSIERGLPRLVGGPAPAEPPPRYPRLREFFGQLPAADPLVLDALAAVAGAATAERPATCLVWFRRLAAADTLDLAPEDGAPLWSPITGDGCVPLAELAVHLRPVGDRFTVVDDGDAPTTVDNLIRPAHVATRTIQELLCHPCAGDVQPAEPPDDGDDGEDADGDDSDDAPPPGPQAVAEEATISGREVRLRFTDSLDDRTVAPAAFVVSTLGADGWHPHGVRRARLDPTGTELTLTLTGTPQARPVRVVVPGAGSSPVLGADGRPLAGLSGTRPRDDAGRDAVLMLTEPSEVTA